MMRLARILAGALGAPACLACPARADLHTPPENAKPAPRTSAAEAAGFEIPLERLASIVAGPEITLGSGETRQPRPATTEPELGRRLALAAPQPNDDAAWLPGADESPSREPLALRLAFTVDRQLDIAAAGAAILLGPGLSIGASLEIPFSDLGYDFDHNRVAFGATLTF